MTDKMLLAKHTITTRKEKPTRNRISVLTKGVRSLYL